MRFKQNQLVTLKGSNLMGRVAGFCHYTRPNEGKHEVLEGVIVQLRDGFYDPAQKTYISLMVCQEDTLQEW